MSPQDHSVVVSFVMRRKNERYPASFRERAQFVEPIAVPMDLFRVTALEFLPAIGIMAELPPWRSAGSDVLGPQVDCRLRLRNAARPQAVDQDSKGLRIGANLLGMEKPFAVESAFSTKAPRHLHQDGREQGQEMKRILSRTGIAGFFGLRFPVTLGKFPVRREKFPVK
jgi:hypothetical protein